VTLPLIGRAAVVWMIASFAILPSACVAPGGGYGDAGSVGVDYYEPGGVDYGGWDSGYLVGPYRDGDHRGDRGRGGSASHAYRPAPASRSTPSIPSGSRGGGGSHSGGSHR
jgi:hypothetical protein